MTNDTDAPRVLLDVSPSPAAVGTTVVAIVTATDNVGVVSFGLTLNGTPLVLDSVGRTTIAADTIGSFDLVATARDAAGNIGTASQTLVVFDPIDPTAPDAQILTPADNAMISSPTDVIGSVTDDNLRFYTLSLAPFGSESFTEFARGTTTVTNGVLGKLDPTMLANDSYVLRLTAVDAAGHTSIDEHVVNVFGDLKLGNFTLSFTDLTVPVAGIPISVTRTYDTLTADHRADLGFGWRLEFRDVSLRTSVAKTGNEADGFFNPFKFGSHVYITLPGGERQGFTFKPKVADGLRGAFIGIFEPRFEPDSGVKSSLTVDPADLRIDADGTVRDFETGLAFNPADSNFGGSYLLTTKEGVAYDIDGMTGQLTEVSDPNNNTLSFSDAGVVSSTGAGITFERDVQGRVAAIVDPAGNRIRYQYDASGDLVSVTDRTNNTTQFVYRTTPAHYLDKVIDPLGRTGVRTEYNDEGRLVKMIDAAGNSVQVAFDPTHSLATITDQLGNPMTVEYDDRGNTVQETDALGGITRRTFDSDNNMLSESDPLGHTSSFTYSERGDVLTHTDPLGNTTISTYQDFTFGVTALAASRGEAAAPFSRTKTTTDALGNTTVSSYDFFGNLVSRQDATGQADTVGNGPSGVNSITDADGATTQYVCDAAGHVVLLTDPLGNATAYTYDADGNPLSEATTVTTSTGIHTRVTRTEYDAQGRVIAVTDPEGGVTRTEYDAVGETTATIDALGRRTEYRYDVRGKLIETIFPDSTPADDSDNQRIRSEYDVAGHETARIDELGRRTEFQFDAAGRLIRTIYPDTTPANPLDNPFTQIEYDLAGKLIARIDELGNRTEFVNDAAGRPTIVRDALGHETITTYDAAGQVVAQTDALGHTTRYIFDTRGFRTETDYADGTRTTTTLDGRGQVIAQTDQAGRTTRFEYDGDGRLTAVVDALNQRTEYQYDEAGELVHQVDANGHVTSYGYDDLGRRTATIKPALPGQSPFRATAQYDAVGNVIGSTDFNGATITFSYDERNRLIAKHYPDGASIGFSYTLTSQLATESDERGTTRFSYDPRDRLLSRTEPDGTVISYGYDTAGNRTAIITPAGTTGYTFDSVHRLIAVTDPEGGVTHYTYDAGGNLVRTDRPDGTAETRSYDSVDRLTFLEDRNAAGVISSDRYTLGPTGRRDAVVDESGRRVDYRYDALDRLTEEKISDPALGNRTIDYIYDAVGNRLSRDDSVEGLTTSTYDPLDRLLTESLGGTVTVYTYDRNGNTLSRVTGSTDRVFYFWDFDNRLIAVDTDGDGTVDQRNVYDAVGIRVAEIVNGQETRFLIDQVRPYAVVVLEYRPSGLITASYVYGHGMISQNRAGQKSFYHTAGLGSTHVLTNSTGVVTDRYLYDAFGRVLSQFGSTINTCLFAGEQRDAITGLDYLRARFMNPNTGRFVSADSFAGLQRNPLTLNPYGYAAQNPLNHTDPTGHFFGSIMEIATSLYVQAALRMSEVAIKYKSLVETVRGVEDLLFLLHFGFAVAAVLTDSSLKTSFKVVETEEDKDARIQQAECTVAAQYDGDITCTLELTIKPLTKVGYEFNVTHPEKSNIQFVVGYKFKVPLTTIEVAGIPVLKLDLALSPALIPSPGIKAAVEGKFGPGALLKGAITFFTWTGDYSALLPKGYGK